MKKIRLFVLAAMLMSVLLCGCGSQAKEVNLGSVLDSIEKQVTLPDNMTVMTADDLTKLYGIDSSEYVQFAGMYTSVGTVSDEILMIEASGSVDDLKAKVDERYRTKQNEMKDYLPDEYAKINECEVRVDGNYIAMFISADHGAMTDIYKAAIGK